MCNYLALRLVLSPNVLKRDSTWALPPRSTIGCIQNDFLSTFGANHELSYTGTNTIYKRTETRFHKAQVLKQFHRVCPKRFSSWWYVLLKPCTYLAPTLTLSPNISKWGSTWPSSLRGSIWCIQKDFWAYGMFGPNRAPILCQDYHYLETDRNEHLVEPRQIGVPSGASKIISKPMVCLVQTVHLSFINTNTISKHTETRFHLTHITLEFYQVHLKWFMSLRDIWCKSCMHLVLRLALSSNIQKNRLPLEPRHLRVPSGVSKTISKLMVCSVQTVHLTDSNTVSKRTEMSFCSSLVT
jgi:hypothetical protein